MTDASKGAPVATPDISSGTASGLMAFMDFMIAKGYGTPSAINPWKSAAKQVFTTVEGEDFGDLDVRTLDVDDYFPRFENRSMGKYSADSLRAYRSRFARAVNAYQSYLKDPNWKPGARRRAVAEAAPASGKRGASHKRTRGDAPA